MNEIEKGKLVQRRKRSSAKSALFHALVACASLWRIFAHKN